MKINFSRKKWSNILLASSLINILHLIFWIITNIVGFNIDNFSKTIIMIFFILTIIVMLTCIYFISKIDLKELEEKHKDIIELHAPLFKRKKNKK